MMFLAFVQSCFVCIISPTRSKIPHPLNQQIHPERVSELLHFDFLFIRECVSGHVYIGILKADFSGYVTLRACNHADTATTAEVLIEHFIAVVPVLQWFSYQGPHVLYKVMELLTDSLGA